MAREQVTTVPRRQAGGAHVACAPAAGRVSDPSASARSQRISTAQTAGSQTRHRHGAPVRAQRGTPAPVPRARARTTRHARTCNGLHSTRVLSLSTLSIRTSTTVTCSKLHHILERAGGVSGELAPSTPVPVGKRNLAVRSPHARTSRRRKRHRVSFFGPARRVYNGVFQSATLNDLFAFLNILYCPRL